MKLKWYATLIMMVAMTLVVVGCSSDNGDAGEEGSSDNQQSSSDGQTEDSDAYASDLRIAVSSNPTSLDPHMTTAADTSEILRNFFETLVALDENFEPQPMLAESVDVSEDGLTYTFNLREGVQFHNGNEMTAEDVEASMNRWLELSSRAALLEGAQFEAADTYIVTMHIDERASDALDILASTGQFPAIMPKEVIEQATEDGIQEYIGTGPFKFNELKQDTYVHLIKFEDYSSQEGEPSGLVGKKEAFVDNLYYDIVSDPSTKLAGLQTGEYDIADRMAFEHYEQINNDNFESYINNDNGTHNIFFNKKSGIMTDKIMRQAVNAAIDSESVMLASYAHEDLFVLNPSYMSVNNKNWSSDAGSESYNQADPEKAKALLDEAGYNGETVTILSTRDYDYHYNAAIVVQEELQNIGMNVELEIFDWPTLVERRNDPANWDILTVGFMHDTTPSQLLFFNPEYPGWVEDEKVYDLLDQVRQAEDQEEATAYWDELQAYMWNDYVPHVMFGHTSVITAANKNLEDFRVFKGPIPWNTKVKK